MISQNTLYAVLNCVRLEGGFADAEDLVILALAIRPDQFPASDLHLAVTECIAQGWIKVLTREDCLADAARWKDQPHQDMEPYQEGSLDFTQEGWEFYVQQHQVKYGGGIGRLLPRGATPLWNAPGQVSLLAPSEDAVLKEIARVRSGSDELRGDSLSAHHTLVEIVGPYAIGPWWVTRFYQAPQAFRADIRFQPPSLEHGGAVHGQAGGGLHGRVHDRCRWHGRAAYPDDVERLRRDGDAMTAHHPRHGCRQWHTSTCLPYFSGHATVTRSAAPRR